MLLHALAHRFGAEHGTNKNGPFHSALFQYFDVLCLSLAVGSGAEGNAGVALPGHLLLDDIGGFCVVGDPDVLNEDPDELGSLRHQPTGRYIRRVVVFVQELLYLFAGAFLDACLVVDDAGHCAGRNARFPRDIINRHGLSSLCELQLPCNYYSKRLQR